MAGCSETNVTRVFGHYIALEMALLCAFELLLSYVLIQTMLLLVVHSDVGATTLEPAAGVLAALLAAAIGVTAASIGLYRPEVLVERRRLLINACVAALAAFPAVLAVSEILHVTLSHTYLLWIAKLLLAWTAGLLVLRTALGMAVRRKLLSRRVLVVGDGERANRAFAAAVSCGKRNSFFDLVGALDVSPPALGAGDVASFEAAGGEPGTRPPGPLSRERLRAARIWGLVVAADGREKMPVADLLRCKLSGVRVFDENQFWEQHLGRINLDTVDPDWMVFADGFSSNRLEQGVRRLADLAISIGLLLFTLPLMLAVAALIKLDSAGPVFYRQQRIGLYGERFTLCKFRSMRVDAEAAGASWAQLRDPRVTRVGSFIRAARIDELPQLVNVLRGEMSFVGPRPERPHFVEELSQAIPFYHERSYVKPGITGWAQVNFPYGASIEDARQKLSYDLYYVKNRSLFLDLLILVSTVRVILFQEGAR
jgi:sugar transferase (PEP-CTERM system associated)